MKKALKIIGLCAFSVGISVIPISSVLATETDTLSVTIDTSCGLYGTNGNYTKTMNGGSLDSSIGSTTLNIACNNPNGWVLQAIGNGATGKTTKLKGATSGTDISTGTATSGSSSAWAFKVTGTGSVSAYSSSFAAIPPSATTVVSSNGTLTQTQISTHYQVYISPTQAADIYTGAVKYSLSQSAP